QVYPTFCLMHTGKLDQCADFQCLMDALSPMDQFFKGSQLSVETAFRNGKFTGARCVRLQLRDLAYASAQTNTDVNGVELVVPLNVLLAQGLSHRRRLRTNTLDKRRKRHTLETLRTASRNIHECYHRRRKRICHSRSQLTSSISTNPNSLVLEPKLFEADMSTPDSRHHRSSCTQNNGRNHDNLTHYPVPLRDCLLSCELDRRSASVSRDRFEVFQDAVHMANLLDPLSKFSVTPQSDNTETPAVSKRSRLTHLFHSSELEPTSQHQSSSS
ncbi:uncharacterized protein DEA37_0014080, partial [Paragonimus westermani]